MFELADGEKIVDLPTQADVFVSGASYHGIFYDTCINPLMSLAQLNTRIREYVGEKPPLRQGGVAILVTPCDGMIDERWRPADLELLQIFNRLGHNPSRMEDYEEEYATIGKTSSSSTATPTPPIRCMRFPVFYENAFILDQASTIIFAGARRRRGLPAGRRPRGSDLGGRVGHGDQGGGQGPVGDGDPAGGLPHAAAVEGRRLARPIAARGNPPYTPFVPKAP